MEKQVKTYTLTNSDQKIRKRKRLSLRRQPLYVAEARFELTTFGL